MCVLEKILVWKLVVELNLHLLGNLSRPFVGLWDLCLKNSFQTHQLKSLTYCNKRNLHATLYRYQVRKGYEWNIDFTLVLQCAVCAALRGVYIAVVHDAFTSFVIAQPSITPTDIWIFHELYPAWGALVLRSTPDALLLQLVLDTLFVSL